MGENRYAKKILVGRLPGKRVQGGPRRRYEENIRTDLEEIEVDGRNWVELAQD